MPKLKTHRGLAKRIKKSGSGKYLRKRAGKSHLLGGKSKKRKRNLKKTVVIDATNVKMAKKMLPYL